MTLLAALLVAFQVAAVQPPADTTTDVDENTTPAEASPLAPAKALEPPTPEADPPGRSLDDILSAVRPVETPAAPAAPEEAPRAGLILATPAGSPTAVAPSFIDDRSARPDGPPTESDILYENRVLGAFRAAQGRQGALDGRWVVARPGGEALYSLQLADPGAGEERIEGAWRNMKAQGLGGSGFIDTVAREGADIVVRFQDTSLKRAEEVRLRQAPDGGWRGEVQAAGARLPVVMSRDVSVELAAKDAPIYIPPPPPVVRAAAASCRKVRSHGKTRTVCSSSSSKASKAGKKASGKSSKKASAGKPKSSKKRK